MKILVVEDDSLMRHLFTMLLESEGWRVSTAAHGRDGLKQLDANCPDLILLDLMMPVMDGFEFLDHLHKNPAWGTIPVVVVTAMELSIADRARLNGRIARLFNKGNSEQFASLVPTIQELFLARNR